MGLYVLYDYFYSGVSDIFSPFKAAPHVEIERERVIHPSDSLGRHGFS